MGAVFQGRDAPPRARYTVRLRRALPALALLLALATVAGMVWLRVIDRVDAGASSAAACSTAAPDGRVQLRVYNATAREGLARTVATQLVGRGYAVLTAENDPLSGVRPVEVPAEVRFGPAGRVYADQVRRQVPGATLYRDAREGAVVDVVLGERYRRLSTVAELAKGRQGIAAPAATPPGAGPGRPAASTAPRC
jgi:hypothetical protein